MKLNEMLPTLNQEAAKSDVAEIRIMSNQGLHLVTFPIATDSEDKQTHMLKDGVGSDYMDKEVIATSISKDEEPKALVAVVDISGDETPATLDEITAALHSAQHESGVGELIAEIPPVDDFDAACIHRHVREVIHKYNPEDLE